MGKKHFWQLVLIGTVALFGAMFFPHHVAASPAQNPSPQKTSPSAVSDLPLFEVTAKSSTSDKLALFISGDGGWWSLDSTVSQIMANHGMPVIGVSSYTYFQVARTPESTTDDMARVLQYYLKKWNKNRIVLMGYSLGAEIMPFVATRLPEDLRTRIAAIVLISPSKDTYFECHPTDWIHTPTDRKTYPVQPEIEKIYGIAPLICATSESDAECICTKLEASKTAVVSEKGGHHYDGDFTKLGNDLWEKLTSIK